MPLFEYVAKDRTGNTINDVFEAPERQMALDKLRSQNLIVISLKEKSAALKRMAGIGGRVKLDDIAVFSRQLATLVDSGIPILEGLDVLYQQTENKSFREALRRVRDGVETGLSLSAAFAKHPKVFSPLYVSMVRAGESSGMLDEILDRLAVYLEKTAALQRKIKAALVYPGVVSGMALAITAVLFIKVVPVFREVFAGFAIDLPTPTRIMIAISDLFKQYFLIWLISMGILGFLVKRFASTNKGRFLFDGILLKLPVFGILFTKVAISKFARTLSTLLKSGVPILACLDIVSKTCGNRVFEVAIIAAHDGIKEGESISAPLAKSKVFPPMVVKMVAIGEKSGEIEKMLGKIADFYDEQVDAAVTALTSLIEPLIIAFLGILIGTIVICMFLPIFQMSSLVNV
ncbi:MAG: type II secretion system F family protein [Candidatus Omnitrophica bacterium]|nr:type II secretion system F family protein [Candidatus Omnitrophota bacterium]